MITIRNRCTKLKWIRYISNRPAAATGIPTDWNTNYYERSGEKQYTKANRKEINKLLWDKLPDALSDDQKKHKVHNLLTALKNKNIIEKDGENQRKANWILKV